MRDDDDGRGVGLSTTDKFSLDLRTRIQQKIYILTQSIMQYTILVRRSSCFFYCNPIRITAVRNLRQDPACTSKCVYCVWNEEINRKCRYTDRQTNTKTQIQLLYTIHIEAIETQYQRSSAQPSYKPRQLRLTEREKEIKRLRCAVADPVGEEDQIRPCPHPLWL